MFIVLFLFRCCPGPVPPGEPSHLTLRLKGTLSFELHFCPDLLVLCLHLI